MSLLEVVAGGVETAFAVASEFVITGTYRHRDGTGSTYDPDSDTKLPAGVDVLNVRFLPTNNQAEEREASPVTVQDLKLLVPGKDLGGKIPNDSGQVFIWDAWWNITLVKAVPGQSLWLFFVRKA